MLQVRLDRSLQHELGISLPVMPGKHRPSSLHLFLDNLPIQLGASRKRALPTRGVKTRATISTNPQIHIHLLFQPYIPMLYPCTKSPQESARENGTRSEERRVGKECRS